MFRAPKKKEPLDQAFDQAFRAYFAKQDNTSRKHLIKTALNLAAAAKKEYWKDSNKEPLVEEDVETHTEAWRQKLVLKRVKAGKELYYSKAKAEAFEKLWGDLSDDSNPQNKDAGRVLEKAGQLFNITPKNAMLSDHEDRIFSEIFALSLQADSLRKRRYETEAKELDRLVSEAKELTVGYVTQKDGSKKKYPEYRKEFTLKLNQALDSDHFKSHRGVEKILKNLLLGLSLLGLVYLKATAKSRGSFWLNPDTESIKKLKKIKEEFEKEKERKGKSSPTGLSRLRSL